MKSTKIFISALMLALPAAVIGIGVNAETHDPPARLASSSHKTITAKRQADKRIMKLPGKRVIGDQLSVSGRVAPMGVSNAPQLAPAGATGDIPQIYGSCVYSKTWTENDYPVGLYKLPMSSSATGELMFKGPDASYGGVIDENIYSTTLVEEMFGIRFVTIKQYDIESRQEIASFEGDNDNVSVGMAKDPVSGDIYGIFYNEAFTSLQFGKISYANNDTHIDAIADLEGVWCAFAIDKDGVCYGVRQNMEKSGDDYVCTASYLFRIDKATGVPTLIGETGQAPQYPSGACFDLRTNKMYWNVCPPDGSSFMCEVNLSTGAASRLYKIANDEEYTGIYIPAPEAADKAPAALSDVDVKFNGASIEAVATMTTPSTLFDGSAPSGNLDLHILASGREVAQQSAGYGEKVTVVFSVPQAGVYDFVIYASNQAGDGPKTKLNNYFVGQDTPAATTATLAYTDGIMHLSWLPVTTSLNGGYINLDDISYTVTRYPDEVVVADKIKATSFDEPIAEPDGIATYYYSVVVNCEGLSSAPANSNVVSLGSVRPPYNFNFLADGLEGWTVIDANNNGLQWEVEREGQAAIRYDDIAMDDWLITPGIKLEAGKAYEFSYDVWSRGIYYPERYELKFGKVNSPEGLTTTLVEPTEVCSADPINNAVTLVPETDGVYYVGFHAISDADSFFLYINNVSVSSAVSSAAPGCVTDLKVVPDQAGKLQAAISFNAPSTTIDGEPLQSLTKIEVMRGETIIKTFNNPTPGEPYSCVDNLPDGGNYTYKVIASSVTGRGQAASVTVYVGVGLPKSPEKVNISTVGDAGDVLVSWDAVTEDVDGKPISPSDVKYNLYDYSKKELQLIAAGIDGTSYTYRAYDGEGQQFVQVAVYPVTDAGMLWGQLSQMIPVGTPYTSIHESFPEMKTSYIWNVEADNGGTWAICNDTMLPGVVAQDGDNGFIAFEAKDGGETSMLATGLVSLEGMENPGFSFYVYNMRSGAIYDENQVSVLVRRSSESDFHLVYESTIVDALGRDNDGWGRIAVSLADFAGETVQVRIQLLTNIFTHTAFDNITLASLPADDLALLDISAPQDAVCGESYPVVVTVANDGMRAAGDSKVNLYAGGEIVATEDLSGLEPGKRRNVEFELTMSPFADADVELYAEVVYSSDSNTANNKSRKVSVKPVNSDLPAVTGLVADGNGEGVALSWRAPDLSTAPGAKVTFDFEDGNAFADIYSDFIFKDLDRAPVGGFDGRDLPGIIPSETCGSFWCWDTETVGSDSPYFDAHSGTKYLFSLYRADNGPADDWAITPELDGSKQTITLFAKSFSGEYAEKVQFLYSTGSTDPADFIEIKSVGGYVPEKWTEYRVPVPAGAKRFAVRSCAAESFMLMVDDMSFIPAGAVSDAVLKGYDVYRDFKLIANVTSTDYADKTAQKGVSHQYSVIAVYNNGLSAPVSILGVSSVANLSDMGVEVSVADGKIMVRGAEGKQVTISGMTGMLLYDGKPEATIAVPVEKGVYNVTVNGTVCKLIAR